MQRIILRKHSFAIVGKIVSGDRKKLLNLSQQQTLIAAKFC